MERHFEVINLRSGTNDPEDIRAQGILVAEGEVALEDHHSFKGGSEALLDLVIWALKEAATGEVINTPLSIGDFH